jgi:excisionase family DNA binding protein
MSSSPASRLATFQEASSPVPKLLTLQEARKLLPLSIRMLYNLAKSRELATVRIGRRVLVSMDALAAFIDARSTGGSR